MRPGAEKTIANAPDPDNGKGNRVLISMALVGILIGKSNFFCAVSKLTGFQIERTFLQHEMTIEGTPFEGLCILGVMDLVLTSDDYDTTLLIFPAFRGLIFLRRYFFKGDAQMQSLQYHYAHAKTLTMSIFYVSHKSVKGRS